MLELIVFAVVLVALQIMGSLAMTFIMLKLFMNKKFIMKYTKMAMETAQEVAEEMEDYL